MLKDLKDSYQNLTTDEQKIFDARMAGCAVSDMNDNEVKAASTGIIFKISVICGCQLPTNDAHINALEQEFIIFLNEFGYNYLTVEEILTAFRMNANFKLQDKIETYGAIFNIDYAAKVLKQYVDKRFYLDHKLGEMYRSIEAQKILDEEEQRRRVKIVTQFKKYIQDQTADLDLADCYMQLVHDGAFADRRFDKTFMNTATEIYNRRGETSSLGEALKYYGVNPEIQFEAGYLAVTHLFFEMKKRGRLEIYNSEWKIIYPGYSVEEPQRQPEF